MYHLSDDNLDKLFGPLKDLEREPDGALWSDISQNLPKPGFMSWGLKHFNVYYVGAGIAAAFLLFISIPKEVGHSQPKEVIHVNEEYVQKTEKVTPEPDQKQPEKRTIPVVREKTEKDKPTQQDTIVTESLLTPVQMVDVPEPIEKKADSIAVTQVKPKKIVKIVRRDTLRVKDTIVAGKRKRNK